MALERGRHAEHCDLDNIICQSEMHFNVTKSNCKFHFTFSSSSSLLMTQCKIMDTIKAQGA